MVFKIPIPETLMVRDIQSKQHALLMGFGVSHLLLHLAKQNGRGGLACAAQEGGAQGDRTAVSSAAFQAQGQGARMVREALAGTG